MAYQLYGRVAVTLRALTSNRTRNCFASLFRVSLPSAPPKANERFVHESFVPYLCLWPPLTWLGRVLCAVHTTKFFALGPALLSSCLLLLSFWSSFSKKKRYSRSNKNKKQHSNSITYIHTREIFLCFWSCVCVCVYCSCIVLFFVLEFWEEERERERARNVCLKNLINLVCFPFQPFFFCSCAVENIKQKELKV